MSLVERFNIIFYSVPFSDCSEGPLSEVVLYHVNILYYSDCSNDFIVYYNARHMLG